MARLSKPRISDEESAEQRLAEADPATRGAMSTSLVGTYQFRKLVRPTFLSHERTKKLWALFVSKHPDKDTLPAEIVPGVKLPEPGITKEFVRFLGYTLRGRLEDHVVKSTVEGYIYKYFALWRQYAFTPVPTPHRLQVMSYFNSALFDETSKLSTKSRPKQTANIVDLEILIRGILEDTKYFRTHRARYNVIYSCLISALVSERPGAIIESGCYRGSNESMTWADHEYWVIPDPKNPYRPFLCLILRSRWLKGMREDESAVKDFFILREPDSHRHVDALMYSLVCAMEDQVFEDVKAIEEIFYPEHPCLKAHKLRIKESAKNQPVFRREVFDGTQWVTSDTLSLPYNIAATYLHNISIFLGFIMWFIFYCFRRCSANNLQAALPEDERRSLTCFQQSYQARLGVIDLGAILAGRLDSNEDNTRMMKAISGMSKDRDPNAPISLNALEMNDLYADPELVEFRREKAKVFERIKVETTKLISLPEGEQDAQDAQRQIILQLRTDIRNIDRKHGAIVSRENYALVALKRKKYFDEASLRQLRGIEPTPRIPLAANRTVPLPVPAGKPPAPGQENQAPNAGQPPPRRARVSRPIVSDPMTDALEIVYNFTLENAGTPHFIAAVNALLGLPLRPFKACYPGESPTHDGKCPVCLTPTTTANMNKGGGSLATHIHSCIMRELKAKVNKEVEDEYEPQACSWTTCSDKTVLQSRAEFCAHVNRHLDNFRFAAKQRGRASCKWKNESNEPCGEKECNDLEKHFARVHSLNVCENIDVQYCAICAESFIDYEGDGELWREHCVDHYATLFDPFATRVETEVDFMQHGVIFTPDVDHCIQFENGAGFNSQRPEFHGHLDHQVPLAPCFCPFCVYDETLSMQVRMQQFVRNQDFQLHLSRHRREILNGDDSEVRECPVPSCGTHTFTAHDLLYHVVVFHRLPICGSTNHTRFRRLRLPTLEDTQPPMQVDAVDLAHLHDDEPSGSASTSVSVPTASTTALPLSNPPVKLKKRRYTAANPYQKVEKNHYCEAHRTQYRDIREHIPAHCDAKRFKIRDPAVKRSQFGPVKIFADWIVSAPVFVPSEAAADDSEESGSESTQPGPSKKPRADKPMCNFKCSGCSKEFADIARHLGAIRKDSSKCKKNRFRVRLDSGIFGEVTTLASWQAASASASVSTAAVIPYSTMAGPLSS
ncbi:hypothetical protein C8R44DRAFT_884651 [Mycena epipterygia]|nr:hypothetical protein C8R44DRAFT_884651 [Mycena epipterygia]